MKLIWDNMIIDFKQPVSYLLPAVIVTLIGAGIYKVCKRGNSRITIGALLLIIYTEVLLEMTFFSREPGSRGGIDMQLLGTWGQTPVDHAYFLENIILFIPFGCLVPIVFKRINKMWICVLLGLGCSCLIEIIQYITGRGFCQLDDIITNTVGSLCGWMLWKAGDILMFMIS